MATRLSPAVNPTSVAGVSMRDGSSVGNAAMRFPVTRTVASSGGSIVVLVLEVVVTVVLGAVVEVVVGQAPARGVQRSTRWSASRAGLPATTTVRPSFFRPRLGFFFPRRATGTSVAGPQTGDASVGVATESEAPVTFTALASGWGVQPAMLVWLRHTA